MNRRRLVLLLAVMLGSLVAATAAWAGFPHFLSFSAPTLVSGDSGLGGATLASTAAADSHVADPRVLVEDIVVGHLGAGEHVETTLTAPFEAVYVCVDEAGNVPAPEHTVTLTGEVKAHGVFRANRHGRATGSLLTEALPAASGHSCPAGQELELDRGRFSQLVLSAHGGESRTIDVTLVFASIHGLN